MLSINHSPSAASLFHVSACDQHQLLSQAADEAAKKARQEQDIREEAARKRLQASGEEAERRRRRAAHMGAAQSFATLLNEVVKDPEARWHEWKPRLDRDPQACACPCACLLPVPLVCICVQMQCAITYHPCQGMSSKVLDSPQPQRMSCNLVTSLAHSFPSRKASGLCDTLRLGPEHSMISLHVALPLNNIVLSAQGRATNPALDARESERLFTDHVLNLGKRACVAYVELLKEMLRPLLSSSEGLPPPPGRADNEGDSNGAKHPALASFEGAERLLGQEPRFVRAPPRERCAAQGHHAVGA